MAAAGDPRADVSITKEDGGWKFDSVQLQLKTKVAGIEADEFKKLAETAKANCPVSKLLNAKITLKADLV